MSDHFHFIYIYICMMCVCVSIGAVMCKLADDLYHQYDAVPERDIAIDIKKDNWFVEE